MYYLSIENDVFFFKHPSTHEILPTDVEVSDDIFNQYIKLMPEEKTFRIKNIDGKTFNEIFELDIVKPINIENIKQAKYNELDQECESTILGKFKVIIDGIEYEFSYDEKAQSRFNGTPYLFNSGIITEIEWTAYANGQRTSVILDKTKFNIVAKAAFEHLNSNINKFREKINKLKQANKVDEVYSIIW